MQVVLHLQGADVTFTQPSSPGQYPWLLEVGAIRLKVRAGHLQSIGANETPSVQAQFNNSLRKVSTLIGQPLRRSADIYDDAGVLVFSGAISQIDYGPVLSITVDA